MTESDYFGFLEMRVSSGLAGMREPELRRLWCDGFIPEKFAQTTKGSHIAGRVYMAGGQDDPWWNFVVLLGSPPRSREAVRWEDLVPPLDRTGWLSLDFDQRFMKVKPLAAYLDRTEAAGAE